jgi:hypothetical protein
MRAQVNLVHMEIINIIRQCHQVLKIRIMKQLVEIYKKRTYNNNKNRNLMYF